MPCLKDGIKQENLALKNLSEGDVVMNDSLGDDDGGAQSD